MKRSLLPITLLFCAATAALRFWQVSAAFEPDTGLPLSGHPATLALCLAVAAGALLLLLGIRPLGRRQVFLSDLATAPWQRWLLTLTPAAFFASAALTLWAQVPVYSTMLHQLIIDGISLPAILGANAMTLYMPLLTTAALLMAGVFLLREVWQRTGAVPPPAATGPVASGLSAVAPAFANCMMLVSIYQTHANDPVVQRFLWPELALFLATLAWHSLSALWFTPGQGRKLLWLCLFAGVLQSAALVNGGGVFGLQIPLLLGGNLLWFLLRGAQLLAAIPDAAPHTSAKP